MNLNVDNDGSIYFEDDYNEDFHIAYLSAKDPDSSYNFNIKLFKDIFEKFKNDVYTIEMIGSISFAKSSLSSSQSDFPILPPIALLNVYAIPPPIISPSTLSNKFSITPIFDETFAPPSIAKNGLFGLFNASPIIPISF